MLRFLKRRSGDGDGDGENSVGSRFIQGTSGGPVVVNLDGYWWGADLDGGGTHLSVRSAGHRETFSVDDHEEALRGAFLRMGRESAECRLLKASLDRRTPVVVIYPSNGRMRNLSSELFEEFLKRRLDADGRDFDALKIYAAPVRRGKSRVVRKFRGIDGSQVLFNLSGEGINYFHLNTTDADVTIDALIDEWPVGDAATAETITKLAETSIRRMDREYFDRLRGGIESGSLILVLPEWESQRKVVLATAGRLLERAPGGGIDLLDPRIIRLHRTTRAAEQV